MGNKQKLKFTIPFVRLIYVSLLAWLLLSSLVNAQRNLLNTLHDTQSFVVMIDSKFELSGSNSVGAGIVFGHTDRYAYIVTADHLVRGLLDEANRISVRFFDSPGRVVAARLLTTEFDKHIDLAVLSVELSEVPNSISMQMTFPVARLSRPIKKGEYINFLGQPNGQKWLLSPHPDIVYNTTSTDLEVQSKFIEPGSSGGAVIDKNSLIVGLVFQSDNGTAHAIPIRRLKEVLERNRFPFDLVDIESSRRSTKRLIADVQKSLNRLNCDAGELDGVWGRRSQYAYERYRRSYKSELKAGMIPNLKMFSVVSGVARPLQCPPFCASNRVGRGGSCVALAPGSKKQLDGQLSEKTKSLETKKSKKPPKRRPLIKRIQEKKCIIEEGVRLCLKSL